MGNSCPGLKPEDQMQTNVQGATGGVWRRNGRKVQSSKQGDLGDVQAGVHVLRTEEPVAQESEHP